MYPVERRQHLGGRVRPERLQEDRQALGDRGFERRVTFPHELQGGGGLRTRHTLDPLGCIGAIGLID